MCGVIGFIRTDFPKPHAVDAKRQLALMADAVVHRGPDDFGYWGDERDGIWLGHRRLSILDLSPAGHQPMTSACGRYVVVFNGEIYNWASIRAELERSGHAPVWRGHSDTEVLLAGIVAWGLAASLRRARGMFAIAVWDRQERMLSIARDRIGEKPLYYGQVGDAFVFASELKSLRAIPGAEFQTDPGSLALMLRYGYVPAPLSIYRNIFKLPPGTLLRVNARGEFGEPETWWSFAETAQQCVAGRSPMSDAAALDALDEVLGSAIGEQMVADVPLGALLSGGLDSSMVVALMQARSAKPVRTFTIGFAEGAYDEAAHAKAVAAHLGTEHTELYVSSDQARAVIPRLADMYDEPAWCF